MKTTSDDAFSAFKRLQHGLGSTNRFFIRRGMSAMKIAEAACLRIRLHGTGDDALEIVSRLNFQRADHGVRGLADRNHQYAVVGMKIVKVFADAQHAAFAGNMPLEGPINAGFSRGRVRKDAAPLLASRWRLVREWLRLKTCEEL